ncbi:DUF1684 domain-containing protein [Glaciihabitans sp. dw_435]|uniref:DUF1684 domain-containing protein n=1 Tax=Glaciihabitans sp. dw_435 TaxID=2720081 RepID=UPI001BD599A6|nr:DUF1684 domain-containing protein [Glaciihabitans sp. dw_435]
MPDASPTIPTSWTQWREARATRVTKPQGDLALIETRWLTDGSIVSTEQALAGQPSTVTVTALTRKNIDNGSRENGIRLWDAASEAIRSFDHIDVFPYAPEWVIEATFTPAEDGRTIPFEHLRDNVGATRDLVVPGDITFTRDGVDYTLSAFDDDGTLLLVFGDPTNGVSTYGSGRFLFVQHTDDPSRVILDFNQSFVPPCGFSIQYNCPLPPRQNRFTVPVTAGEKNPVFTGGYSVH